MRRSSWATSCSSKLPEAGKKLAKGDTAVVVESVKAASDVYAPVDGEIIEANDGAVVRSGAGQLGRHGDGWLWKMKLADEGQLAGLMDEAGYKKHDRLNTDTRHDRPTIPLRRRHIGPSAADTRAMLATIGVTSLETLITQAVPKKIRLERPLDLPAAATEAEALAELANKMSANTVLKSFVGLGYHGTTCAAGDPAQSVREPGLVHRLHALPGRDQPGPAGNAVQFPDAGRPN